MLSHSGNVFVLSAPSGTGKSTLAKQLVKDLPDLDFSVSFTTRGPGRGGARQGLLLRGRRHLRRAWSPRTGSWSGCRSTSAATAPARPGSGTQLASGRDILLDIETQGARQVHEAIPDAVMVFLLPPSAGELSARLRGRGDESEEQVRIRLEYARHELAQFDGYDYLVVNDTVDQAYRSLNPSSSPPAAAGSGWARRHSRSWTASSSTLQQQPAGRTTMGRNMARWLKKYWIGAGDRGHHRRSTRPWPGGPGTNGPARGAWTPSPRSWAWCRSSRWTRPRPKQMAHAAISGMLHTLDPHSYYMDEAEFRSMREEQRGSFFGIGSIIVQQPDGIVIVSTVRGGPSEKVGSGPATSSGRSTASPPRT